MQTHKLEIEGERKSWILSALAPLGKTHHAPIPQHGSLSQATETQARPV